MPSPPAASSSPTTSCGLFQAIRRFATRFCSNAQALDVCGRARRLPPWRATVQTVARHHRGQMAHHLEWVVVGGLGIFGFAFAVNSSVHSYLVLAYAGSEKAAEDVGFYYAANAVGRFFGTLMSGLLYQWGGLLYALSGSAVMLVICWLVTLALPVTRTMQRVPA